VTSVLHRVTKLVTESSAAKTDSRLGPSDPNWYRGHYILAVAYANVAQAQEQAQEKDLSLEIPDGLRDAKELAQSHVRSVALVLESNLDDLKRRRLLRRRERTFSEFLEALEPTVLLLLAGTIRRWGSAPSPSERFAHGLLDRRSLVDALTRNAVGHGAIIEYVRGLQLDYRAQYNLACYYAGIGDKKRPKRPWKTGQRASDGDDEIATSIGDETQRGKDSVPGERLPRHVPPPEYVHAFSELGQALKTAPADLVEWAQDDPSLAGLRDDEELGPRLKKLIKELTPAEGAPRRIPGSPMNARPQ
jgi:hypothetical protein